MESSLLDSDPLQEIFSHLSWLDLKSNVDFLSETLQRRL
jgi:hypothetical protein